jgi:hypothetical protein
MNTLTTINTCAKLRSWVAESMISALSKHDPISETEFTCSLQNAFSKNPSIHSGGWYNPPPSGIAVLFATPNDYKRLQFDTLRKEEFWPKDKYKLENAGIGILYASPIDINSGIIGDFGISIYKGKEKRILDHFARCLNVLEQALGQIEVTMEMREIHDLTKKIIAQHHLTNARTVTWTDKVGTNLGHTIPWSYEEPNRDEVTIIKSKDIAKISDLISNKRINVNRLEKFKIPKTIAFTLEARLESLEDPLLPNVFFHLIACFQDGKKTVLANFNELFQVIGMDGIRSKY